MSTANADDERRKKLPEGPMVVEAIQTGHYGRYRDAGDRFTIKNGRTDFSFRWMKKVSGRAAEEVKEQEEAKDQPQAAPEGDGVL